MVSASCIDTRCVTTEGFVESRTNAASMTGAVIHAAVRVANQACARP